MMRVAADTRQNSEVISLGALSGEWLDGESWIFHSTENTTKHNSYMEFMGMALALAFY